MIENDNIIFLLAATRSVLLVICELAGIICIYLGWKLYMKAITSTTEGEFSGPGFKFKLVSGGPGVFLCGLGIWLLLSISNRPFEMSTTAQQPTAFVPDNAFHQTTTTQLSRTQPPKRAENRSVCVLRTEIKLDTGQPDIATADIERAASNASSAIIRAGQSAIKDDEERAETVSALNRLADIARKNNAKPENQ